MAVAFQCDLCGELRQGKPLARHTFTADGQTSNLPSQEWCEDCLLSFQDWRASRMPTPPESEG